MAISAEQAAEELRSAFLPLRCGAEVFDFNQKVRFRVFGEEDQPLLSMANLVPDDYFSAARLTDLINRVRQDLITHAGVNLEPWELSIRDAT